MTETIFAPATGPGASAISVIRISGPRAMDVIEEITGRSVPEPRMLSLRPLHDCEGRLIDQAMVVVFPDTRSFTGESSAEIQCHGGAAVVQEVLDRLGAEPECRLADPGEFTRRAVLNGKMDLVQAEGLGDLVSAETSLQREQALRMMGGGAGEQIEAWRALLIRTRALVEVTIDWADEEVPEDVSPEVSANIGQLLAEIGVQLDRGAAAERMRQGFEVALIGAPNAGKSTLLNAIAGRDVAIVTDIPGTTRDVLEVKTDLSGLPVIFLDTAGMREAADVVEAEGIERARSRAEAASLRVHVRAGDVEAEDSGLFQDGDIEVWTKSDLGLAGVLRVLSVSGKCGEGVSALLDLVHDRLKSQVSEQALLGHRRQLIALREAQDCLGRCIASRSSLDAELLAEELRGAIAALDRLTGRQQIDDMLDTVFGSFCLGK